MSYMSCIMHLLWSYSLRVHAFSVGEPTGWSLKMELSPGTADSELLHSFYIDIDILKEMS